MIYAEKPQKRGVLEVTAGVCRDLSAIGGAVVASVGIVVPELSRVTDVAAGPFLLTAELFDAAREQVAQNRAA